ncbi:MAG: ribonuclease HII [Epulopiscium sp.]|nr:ribonuclease HII [Candidatus Epulonipiscium sp.]
MTKQKTIAMIEEELKNTTLDNLPKVLYYLEKDSRKGVKRLVQQYKKQLEQQKKEQQRLKALWKYEEKYYLKNQFLIAGIDEAGRGPLAGPVVAAAVILPPKIHIPQLNDSKKISTSIRENLYKKIQSVAIDIGVGIVDPETIDQINILQATKQAMQEAVLNLKTKPEILLIDALILPSLPIQQEKIIKGDQKSASIAASSIIAKVTRDHLMERWDQLYPVYGFANHKGYGTKEHLDAIKVHGLSPIHRRSFHISRTF